MGADPTPQKSRAMLMSGLTAAMGLAALVTGFMSFLVPVFWLGTFYFFMRARHVDTLRLTCPACDAVNEVEYEITRYQCRHCAAILRREGGWWVSE